MAEYPYLDAEPADGQTCVHCHKEGHLACGENLQDLLALFELSTASEWEETT